MTTRRMRPTVRAARPEDAAVCAELDLSYSTTHIWQLETRRIGAGGWNSAVPAEPPQILQTDEELHVSLRVARLPRALELVAEGAVPSRTADAPHQLWLVAELEQRVVGYLTLWGRPDDGLGYLQIVAVHRPYRRRGAGTALLTHACRWAERQKLRRLMTDLPARNFPAICLLQKAGFYLCGYNDSYYPNGEIALFFNARMHR